MKRHANRATARDFRGLIHPRRGFALAGMLILAQALDWPGPAAGAVSPSAVAQGVTLAEGGTRKKAAGKTEVARGAEERLGVKIRGVRLSAAGFMLDLRYRVLDAAKAAPLLDRNVQLYLLAPTGARFGVPASPKVGQLRSTRRGGEIRLDRDYSMLFGNPGHYLQQGSKVTLVVGEQKIENLTVE